MLNNAREREHTAVNGEPRTYEGMLRQSRLVGENVPDDEDEICLCVLEDCLDALNREKRISGPVYCTYYTQDFRLKDTGYGIRKIWERSRFR